MTGNAFDAITAKKNATLMCKRERNPTDNRGQAMRGAGFLAIWSDVERKDLTDYRHWLTREHTTECVIASGFLATRVFQARRTFALDVRITSVE